MRVPQTHLDDLYAQTDDPWNFDTSASEQAKFTATRNALSRGRYGAALELGCGNGALARHLAPLCDRYVGVDAVPRAVAAAQARLTSATFRHLRYPAPLPDGPFDLIVLSEILYFLAPEDLHQLARDIRTRSPAAEVLCVSYLGDTGNDLQGAQAFDRFALGMADRTFDCLVDTGRYRIDRSLPGSSR